MTSVKTPAELGFQMPAEWAPQEGVWLSWPHKEASWPGKFEPVPAVFGQIAREISEVQFCRINVANEAMEKEVRGVLRNAGANLGNVTFHHNPTDDAWVRDHGPIYVTKNVNGNTERVITKWGYNAWGDKYPPYDLDNTIPYRVSTEFNEPLFEGGMILEGGSIDVNGAGVLLTTTSCLLNKNRNPQLTQSDIEAKLREYLGIQKVLWLGDGIEGDDTDGHIDDITRFVNETTIVTVLEPNTDDSNHAPLQENYDLLKSMTDINGRPFNIVALPMPDSLYYEETRLPASYANFLIINEKVLVPTYRSRHDAEALDVLQQLMPQRKVVGIDCTDLVWGLGAIHCVTQQQPAKGR